jgi:predicted acylesterase/phospholipase RssA
MLDFFHSVNVPLVPDWMEKRVDEQLLAGLLRNPHFRQIFGFVECGGLYSGNAFCEWLKEKLARKGVSADCTLAQLHAQKKCDLSLVVTDTTNREMLVLNHRTAPDVPLVMAVRMSMSIPFVWREVVWQSSWGRYDGRDKTDARIVDGGALSNFPINLIAGKDDWVATIMGEDADPNAAGNLGLLIDESLPVEGIDPKPPRRPALATVQRIQRLVDTLTGARDNALIARHKDEICRLPAAGYGTTEFDMASAKLDALVEAGRRAMRDHLRSRGLLGAGAAGN